MKLKAIIREEIKPSDKTIIVEFEGDKKKQHFEVKCLFSPFYLKMRKWDSWLLSIKWESEIFIDSKTGDKSYFTHLILIVLLKSILLMDQNKKTVNFEGLFIKILFRKK